MSEGNKSISLIVTGRQLVGLFLILKSNELELDDLQSEIYTKIEQMLYSFMSIDDLENIETRYIEGYTFGEIPGEFFESTE